MDEWVLVPNVCTCVGSGNPPSEGPTRKPASFLFLVSPPVWHEAPPFPLIAIAATVSHRPPRFGGLSLNVCVVFAIKEAQYLT